MAHLSRCENPDCGKTFVNHGNKKYCDSKCRQKAYRMRHDQALTYTPQQHAVKCDNCGKCFVTTQPRARFCKVSCRVSFWQQQKRLAAKEIE